MSHKAILVKKRLYAQSKIRKYPMYSHDIVRRANPIDIDL